jgi:hypothetical protein
MAWVPDPRPDWVAAANAGLNPAIAAEAGARFDRDQLLAEARAALGLPDLGISQLGDDRFLTPLDILLRSLDEEAELTIVGRWLTRRMILRLLQVRLQMTAYLAADPALADEEIHAPLFVTGAPRTGTTILFALLAQDRALRAPEGWELLRPVPPPDPSTFEHDARIAIADRELTLPTAVVSGIQSIHVYAGRMPKECVSAMSFEFLSDEFTVRYNVPTYTEWLLRCDMRPAYEAHRRVLQLLQRRYDKVQWVLKSPVHLNLLPTLFDVYPDARVAITHRDPLKVIPSLTSLVASLRWAHSENVDFAAIGAEYAEIWVNALDTLVTRTDSGALPNAQIHHSAYADFLAAPIDTVAGIYKQLDLPFSDAVADAMQRHLSENPQGAHGSHSYSFADLGLDPTTERTRFDRYQRYFSVPVES